MFIFLLFLNDWFKFFFIFFWDVFNLYFFVRFLFFCIFLMKFFCVGVVDLNFLMLEFLFFGNVLLMLGFKICFFFLYFILVVLFFFGKFVFLRKFIDFFKKFVLFIDIWCVDWWSWLEYDFFIFFFFIIVFCNDVLRLSWLVLFFVFIN